MDAFDAAVTLGLARAYACVADAASASACRKAALATALALSVLTRWGGQPGRARATATCWAKAAVSRAAGLRGLLCRMDQV